MDIGLVVKAFIDEMSQPPQKVMLLGPFHSQQAVIIGDVSKYMNIVEVGYISSDFISLYDI